MPRVARQWNELTGVLGVALVSVALFLPGAPPKAADTTAQLTSGLLLHRHTLVAGTLLAGVGFMALIWFTGVVACWLQPEHRGERIPAPLVAVAGGGMAVVLMFVGMLIFAGVAFRSADMHSPASVRVAVDTGNMLIEASKYGIAVLITAACAGNAGQLPRWLRGFGITAAAVAVVSTAPPFLDASGIGQFGGGIDLLGGIPAFVWLAALSLRLATAAPD
jgi:hypothetical protein